jgi:hypothetical protein
MIFLISSPMEPLFASSLLKLVRMEEKMSGPHYPSKSVVMVMVWLCNSHLPPGVKGQISP